MWRKCRILQNHIYRFPQILYIGIVIKRTKIALLRGNFAKIRLANHIYRVCFICICVLPVPPRPSFPCRGDLARLFWTERFVSCPFSRREKPECFCFVFVFLVFLCQKVRMVGFLCGFAFMIFFAW
jgi:hypothetical protein